MSRRKNSRTGLLCTLGILAALAVGTAGFLLLEAGDAPPGSQDEAVSGVYYADAKEGRLPGFEESGETGGDESFVYRLCGRPIFPAGDKPGDVMFENTPGNEYPMEVVYWLEDTGEAVYRSGLILPGAHLERDALVVPLERGEYPATAEISVFQEPGGEVLSAFSEAVTLVVEK